MKLGILNVEWRSWCDRFLGELAPTFDEARAYLKVERMEDAEHTELAKLIIHDWDAYEWIEASVYGRVRRKVGAYDPLRESFRLLSACLVTYGFRQLIPTFGELERAETLEEFGTLLITKNPGSRDLPTGLNALSGLCALMDLHRLILRGWHNFHLSGFIHGDLSTLSEHAERGEKLLHRVTRGGKKGADTRRKEEWEPRLKRIKDWEERLKAETPRRKLTRAISDATGIPLRTVSRHRKKPQL